MSYSYFIIPYLNSECITFVVLTNLFDFYRICLYLCKVQVPNFLSDSNSTVKRGLTRYVRCVGRDKFRVIRERKQS